MLKPSENMIRTPHRSQYSLVIAVAKRAREIAEEAEKNKEILVEKPVDLAVQDFMADKFKIVEPDPAAYVDDMPDPTKDMYMTGVETDEEAEDGEEVGEGDETGDADGEDN